MSEIATTTSLIAFGLILVGMMLGCFYVSGRNAGKAIIEVLRRRREWRENLERWMRLLE